MSAFDKEVQDFASGLGIKLYQRFTVDEAALFLRIPTTTITKLIKTNAISYIQLTKTDVEFFGFQLIDYLIKQTRTTVQLTIAPQTKTQDDRIIRYAEVQKKVGLSRTTIWRKERAGEFPKRISLGVGAVGWRESEINAWIDSL